MSYGVLKHQPRQSVLTVTAACSVIIKFEKILFKKHQNGCSFKFFIPFAPSGNPMFGYVSADRADGLVFLREWHVTPHLFVFLSEPRRHLMCRCERVGTGCRICCSFLTMLLFLAYLLSLANRGSALTQTAAVCVRSQDNAGTYGWNMLSFFPPTLQKCNTARHTSQVSHAVGHGGLVSMIGCSVRTSTAHRETKQNASRVISKGATGDIRLIRLHGKKTNSALCRTSGVMTSRK